MSSKNTKDKSSEKDWFDSRVEVIGLTPERNKQIKEEIKKQVTKRLVKTKGISIITNLESFSEEDINSCDIILCISGSEHYTQGTYKSFAVKYPHMKRILYLWDLYPWVEGYSIIGFPFYDEIWVPSNEVGLRVNEFYSSDQKTKIIKWLKDYSESYDERDGALEQAVKSDRTTLYNEFKNQGHDDMAEILRKL